MFYFAITVALAAILYGLQLPLLLAIFISCLFYVCIQHKWVYVFMKTFRRDLKFVLMLIRFAIKVIKNRKKLIPELFSDTVKKFPDKVALISVDTEHQMTFSEVENFANKIGNVFLKCGFKRGDVVGIYLRNELEYIPIWLGLSKIGVVAALINTNLRHESLQYSLESGKCKAVITESELIQHIRNIRSILDEKIVHFILDLHEDQTKNENGFVSLRVELSAVTNEQPIKPEGLSLEDHMLYIYTSGTTGLPKPVIMPGIKVLQGLCVFCEATNATEVDIVYNVMPMYHSSGSIIFAGQMLLCGATMVVRRKFSASEHFKDCVKYNITFMPYIGEMCRYLLLQPEQECERMHKIRCAVGNGLRMSLFTPFRKRFQIKHIFEFYGASEANSGFINAANKDGAIGYLFVSFWFLNTRGLVKVDQETGSIIRGKNGLAVKCKPGEPGQLVNSIFKGQEYNGYVDKIASEKKMARNIFRHGDVVFLTGDLLVEDSLGYLYFLDRLGDTYRWKGENVSTTEVENVISDFMKLADVLVYPVKIPGSEGTAGMAYVNIAEGELDVKCLGDHIKENLPSYAVPLFIRAGIFVPITGTFKHQKKVLKREGWSVAALKDNELLYFYNADQAKYVAFTSNLRELMMAGKLRF